MKHALGMVRTLLKTILDESGVFGRVAGVGMDCCEGRIGEQKGVNNGMHPFLAVNGDWDRGMELSK